MIKRPIVNHAGHRWYLSDDSSLGNDYYRLERVAYLSDLKQRRYVATVIDVKKETLNPAPPSPEAEGKGEG